MLEYLPEESGVQLISFPSLAVGMAEVAAFHIKTGTLIMVDHVYAGGNCDDAYSMNRAVCDCVALDATEVSRLIKCVKAHVTQLEVHKYTKSFMNLWQAIVCDPVNCIDLGFKPLLPLYRCEFALAISKSPVLQLCIHPGPWQPGRHGRHPGQGACPRHQARRCFALRHRGVQLQCHQPRHALRLQSYGGARIKRLLQDTWGWTQLPADQLEELVYELWRDQCASR